MVIRNQQTLQLFNSDHYYESCVLLLVHLGGTLRLGSGQHYRIQLGVCVRYSVGWGLIFFLG